MNRDEFDQNLRTARYHLIRYPRIIKGFQALWRAAMNIIDNYTDYPVVDFDLGSAMECDHKDDKGHVFAEGCCMLCGEVDTSGSNDSDYSSDSIDSVVTN